MLAYIVRRLLYLPLIVFGVLLITFGLFHLVRGDTSAQDLGRMATAEQIAEYRQEMGLDKPLVFNFSAARERGAGAVFDSQFFNYFWDTVTFDFGRNKYKQKITTVLWEGAGPSLRLTVPMFIGLLVTSISFALVVAYRRGRPLDVGVVGLCVLGMSVPTLAVIMFGQYFLAAKLRWFPIQGYAPGLDGIKYLVLPVLLGIVGGLGANVRFYRTVMLDEINADYVRTARAKGVATPRVLFVHVLKNAMIPVITSVVMAIPFLFLGSLLLERFFGIPGLGYLMIDAIGSRDGRVIQALTFIISILFVLANLATDVCYSLVDPRVSLD